VALQGQTKTTNKTFKMWKEEEEEEEEEKGEMEKDKVKEEQRGKKKKKRKNRGGNEQEGEKVDFNGGEEREEEVRDKGNDYMRDHKFEEDDKESFMKALEVIQTLADKYGKQLEKADDNIKVKDRKIHELERRLELEAKENNRTVNNLEYTIKSEELTIKIKELHINALIREKDSISGKFEKVECDLKVRDNEMGELEHSY